MSELLPCPFCGGEARMTYDLMADGLGYSKIECRECGANTPGNYSKVGDQATWDWNTRHERTCRTVFNGLCENDAQSKKMGYFYYSCSACGGGGIGDNDHYCRHCGAKVVDP